MQSYGVSVDDIVNGKITGEQLAQYGISSSILDGVNNDEVSEEVKNAIEGADIPRDLQVAAIEKADLPAVFKTQFTTGSTDICTVCRRIPVKTNYSYYCIPGNIFDCDHYIACNCICT